MSHSQDTLYQRVLGKEFAQLPPVLHEFHSLPQGGQAQGMVLVQYGRGLVRCTLAKLLRLPPEGESVKVNLQVKVEDGHEIWVRHFDGLCVQTKQWQRDNLLIEKAGPLCFAFRMSANQEGLRFDFSHNEIAGIKLPFPVLKVDALARGMKSASNCGWHITVVISAPLLGVLAEYRGEITS